MSLLIIGFGYSAQAFAREWGGAHADLAVTARNPATLARLNAAGIEALAFDGESIPEDLIGAIGRATQCLVTAPPGEAGDPVLSMNLLAHAGRLRRVLYLSTVGVYGDHGGAWVDEWTPVRPMTPRAGQRVAAEEAWRDAARRHGFDLGIFRLSGIYGPGRSAIDAMRAGTARRIIKPGQVFNRIHVGDIAGALVQAFRHDGALATYNLTDDEPAPPQDVIAHAAGLLGLPVPPDIPFDEAVLSEMGRSFYGEAKRVANARIKRDLGYAFRFPDYRAGLAVCL